MQTSNCSLLLIYRPQRDERLSWPGWLTYSGRFTHISGHSSATGQVQDRESPPTKDRRSRAVPRNQPNSRKQSRSSRPELCIPTACLTFSATRFIGPSHWVYCLYWKRASLLLEWHTVRSSVSRQHASTCWRTSRRRRSSSKCVTGLHQPC